VHFQIFFILIRQVGKNLSLFSILAETQGVRFNEQARPYVDLFFENLNTGYEEVIGPLTKMPMLTSSQIRQQLALILHAVEGNLRRPGYISTDALLVACTHEADPLRVSVSPYLDRVKAVVDDLSRWRNERLPPPLTGQSQVSWSIKKKCD
jgi:proteasome activator subunit 4